MSLSVLAAWLVPVVITAVVVVAAVWLVRGIARDAISRAQPEDVPEVLSELRGMIGEFHPFVAGARYKEAERGRTGDNLGGQDLPTIEGR